MADTLDPRRAYAFWRALGWPAMSALRAAYLSYRGRLHLSGSSRGEVRHG